MENHGINMIGNYFMESVSGPAAAASANERRLIYSTSDTINGITDARGAFRMFYSGKDSNDNPKWLRPLVANDDDKPDRDADESGGGHILGSATKRWRAIYSKDFYGSVRYS